MNAEPRQHDRTRDQFRASHAIGVLERSRDVQTLLGADREAIETLIGIVREYLGEP